MTYDINADKTRRLLVVATAGDASFEAFRTLIGELLSPPYVELDYDTLIDNRRLNLRSLTHQEAESLADLLAQHMDEASQLKHALVVDGALSYGISRLFELRASSIHNLPMRVFLSYDDALSWLRPRALTEGGDGAGA